MDKSWLKSYPPGVPSTVNLDTYQTLPEALLKHCEQFADNVAFTCMGVDLEYGEFNEESERLAACWQAHGLKKGDRIAIILPNLLQYPIAFFAAARIGLTIVNVNPMYTARELTHQLQDAGVRAVVVLDIFSGPLFSILSDVEIDFVYLTSVGDMMPWPKGQIISCLARIKKPPHRVPSPKSVTVVSWKRCMKLGKRETLKPVVIQSDDIALLQYTSATTGVAKGAMISHKNLLSNIMQCLTWMKSGIKQGGETVLAALPLYHIFSLTVCSLSFLFTGSRVLLIVDPRNVKGLIRTLHRIPVTVFVGLNTLFQALLLQPNFSYANFSQLKLTVAGGMPTQKSVADHWQQVTGSVILEGYGLTEASPVVAINPLNATHFVGSVGLPIPNTEVRIKDPSGIVVADGRVGELYVQGPQVMQGYWHNPEATAEVLNGEGWLRTGDLARMDEQGFLYIVDRKKDMILVSGFNVYPNEVEEVLVGFDNVNEAAVIGVPDEQTGEAVLAFIVAQQKVKESDIIHYCRSQLAGYKVPKRIEFVDELPKSNVGKILRRELRDEYVGK